MVASIFIASMVATVWPASTSSPSATCSVTTPANGAATWPRVAAVGLLGGLDVGGDRRGRAPAPAAAARSASDITVRKPRSSGSRDRLQLDEQRDAGLQLDGVLDARAPARRGSPCVDSTRRVAVGLAVGQVLLGRPGEQQPVQRRRGGPSPGPRGPRRTAPAGSPLGRTALQRPGAERLRPAAGRVAELAAQEADHGVGDVELAGVGLEVLRRRRPAPTRCSARSPTTFDDGVTFTSRPSIRSAAAYRSSICSNRSPRPSAMACWRRLDSWPPGISWW